MGAAGLKSSASRIAVVAKRRAPLTLRRSTELTWRLPHAKLLTQRLRRPAPLQQIARRSLIPEAGGRSQQNAGRSAIDPGAKSSNLDTLNPNDRRLGRQAQMHGPTNLGPRAVVTPQSTSLKPGMPQKIRRTPRPHKSNERLGFEENVPAFMRKSSRPLKVPGRG